MKKEGIMQNLSEKNVIQSTEYDEYIKADKRGMDFAFAEGRYAKVCAEGEQVIEKCMKAVGRDMNTLSNSDLRSGKGHDLVNLNNKTKKLFTKNGKLSQKDLEFASKAYYGGRYPDGHKKYTQDDAIRIIDTANKAIKIKDDYFRKKKNDK